MQIDAAATTITAPPIVIEPQNEAEKLARSWNRPSRRIIAMGRSSAGIALCGIHAAKPPATTPLKSTRVQLAAKLNAGGATRLEKTKSAPAKETVLPITAYAAP